jgi:endoglucanase
VADNSFIVPREMVQFLESLADDNDMPYQYKTPLYGGTDAGAIHDSGKGVKCGVVSVPCRYIHAPLAMLRLSDLEHTVTLVDAFVRRAPEQFA